MSLALAVALLAVGQPAPSEIAYVSHGSLYVIKCDATGIPVAKPIRVCAVRKADKLSWISAGEIEVDDLEGNPRYTVKPIAGAKPKKAATGDRLFASPIGSATIVVHVGLRGLGRRDAYLVDSKGKRTLIAENIDRWPVWSPKGDHIGLVVKTSRDGTAELMRYPNIRDERGLGEAMNMRFISFSPDGKWAALAYGWQLRPGAAIADVATGRRTEVPMDKGLGGVFDIDWSPDGSKLLISKGQTELTTVNFLPSVSIFDLATRRLNVLILRGADKPLFCADSRHVIWMEGWRSVLVAVDSENPTKKRVIARDVDEFTLRQ